MKSIILLTSLIITATGFARTLPPLYPMPAPLPTLPEGANSATYPAPQMDWTTRVRLTNKNVRKIADSIHLVFDGDSITDWWQGGGRKTRVDRTLRQAWRV